MNIEVLGVHIDGGMTEFVCVPEQAVVTVDGLSADQAAMVEFLAIGAHAVRRADVTPEDRVLVVGAGPIGVGVALFADLIGAEVTIMDTSVERLRYAQTQVGITHIVQAGPQAVDALVERTDGEFFDVVFDATGNAKAIEAGFAYVAHGGRYVLVSVVKDIISFSDPEFHKRETTLLGSRNATAQDFIHVIDSIRRGVIPTAALQTHTFPLLEAPTHIRELIANQGNVLKAIAVM